MDSQPELIADRAYALRTCPAKAPPRESYEKRDLDDEAANSWWLHQVAVTVHEFLETLPRTQRAHLYVDPPRPHTVSASQCRFLRIQSGS